MAVAQSTLNSLGQLIEFVLNKNGSYVTSWTFFIPPESLEQEEAVRQNTTRTLSGGYSDLFGPDLPVITLEGTTGLSERRLESGQFIDGYGYWLQFLQTVYHTFIESPLDHPSDEYGLHFYNWTHRRYYSVMPTAVTWDMAVPENTVFYYHMEMTALEPLLRPSTSGYGSSYDQIVINNTANFQAVSVSGATHGAMALTLLGYGA